MLNSGPVGRKRMESFLLCQNPDQKIPGQQSNVFPRYDIPFTICNIIFTYAPYFILIYMKDACQFQTDVTTSMAIFSRKNITKSSPDIYKVRNNVLHFSKVVPFKTYT